MIYRVGKLFMAILAAGARMAAGIIFIAFLPKSCAGKGGEMLILLLQAWTHKALKLQLVVTPPEGLMPVRILNDASASFSQITMAYCWLFGYVRQVYPRKKGYATFALH